MPSFKIIGLLVLEKIFKVFTIYGHGGHLGHVTWTIYINFRSPWASQGGSTLNLALIGQVVSEENMFENVNGRTDDDYGRRIHGYPISSPVSLRLR